MNMKIAILGSNGFVGSSLFKYLCDNKKNIIFPVSRETLNLLNPIEVKEYLKDKKFDVVINAASSMKDAGSLYDTRNNLGIFINFYNNSNLFGKFINLASGAEYDRTLDINLAEEEVIFKRLPDDSYGFGQNIKSRLSYEKENFYNLRIFNCFGQGEISTRIFPKFIRAQTEAIFEIQNDRYFDYFSIQDLCKVVENFLINDYSTKDINCVYLEKNKISDVIKKFSSLNNLKSNYTITSTSNLNYTGSGLKLNSLGIKLNGLEHGLSNYVQN